MVSYDQCDILIIGAGLAGASTAFMARDSGDLDAVGLRSRVAVLLSRPDFPNDLYVIGAGPEYPELAVLPSRLPGGQPAALTALRDVVVTASVHDLALSVEVFDPFALRPIGRPTTVATLPDVEASTTLHRRAIDISGLDKHGLAAVCYGVPGPERGRGDDAIWLQIVDERGAPWAAPVPIVESGFRGSIVNCSVGNDGAGFLVGWWDGSVLWVRRVDLAL